MKRALAIAALSCAPLLTTQTALAQDCFCGVGIETVDTTIESTIVGADAPAPMPVSDALLCRGGNDPRCMPMHTSDSPAFRALSGGPVAAFVDLEHMRLLRHARAMTSVTPAEGLAPARGVTITIDRPPRG